MSMAPLKPTRTTSLWAFWACVIGLATGCTGTPPPNTLQNENKELQGLVRAQERRIEELTKQRKDLERQVSELEGKSKKEGDGGAVRVTESVDGPAKGEMSAQVRRMLDRFKGDSDIEVEPTADGYLFVLREKVLFESASAVIGKGGREALHRVADALRGGTALIVVEGHTDDVALSKPETLKQYPRGNIELSVARALAVWDYLAGDGDGNLEKARLSVVGYGPHRPRVPNDSDRNRYRNRRVEIRVIESG
ncbi:MAG: OmpA/MotB family protein [Planctomycetota bacterium]